MLLPNHCSGRNNGREWREVVENACSYQVLLITIEIKDMDEDRRKIFSWDFTSSDVESS